MPVSPSDDYKEARAFSAFVRKYQENGECKLEEIPVDADTSTVHSPWREEVYYTYNHIFYDVADFLSEAAAGVGHFHPPSHEVFALARDIRAVTHEDGGGGDGGGSNARAAAKESEEDGHQANGAARRMKWPTNVLLIPAYLAPGVKVCVRMIADRPQQDGGAEEEGRAPERTDEVLGTWDGSNDMEVWYLRAGAEVAMVVEGRRSLGHPELESEAKGENGGDEDGEGAEKGQMPGKLDEQASKPSEKGAGVDAVFVVGVLCTLDHQTEAAAGV